MKKFLFAISLLLLVSNLSVAENATNTSKTLQSLNDLEDKRVAVLLRSTHDIFAQKRFPQATIMQYKTPADVLLAVISEKVDAGIYNSVSMSEILKVNPNIAVIGEPFEFSPVAFGFSKDNEKLLQQFNAFFKLIKTNGVYEQIIKRWTMQENPEMPIIATPNKNGLIVAGHVSDAGLPFVTIRDNQLVGMNIELAKRFAAYLGKDIQFEDMQFGSLIPALTARKIDVIAMTLTITEERKQKVNFAEPYYQIGMNAFTLKKNIAGNLAEKDDMQKVSFFQSFKDGFTNNILLEKRYLILLDGLETTMWISILATLFGSILGGLICFMHMSKLWFLNIPAKIYISILRGIPVLVILLLIFYVVFAKINLHPILVATIAFGMNFAAYVAEVFRTGIEGVDKGQSEAGIAMGLNKLNTFIYIIAPQAFVRVLPVYKGEFISLVKMTSIVGYIAVQDLTKASDIIRSRTFDAFFPIIAVAIVYYMISWLLLQSLNYLERATDPKFKRKNKR